MLIDTLKSPYAKVTALPQQDITLAAGLWKRMADNCAAITIPHILSLFEVGGYFHEVENFRIAAGELEGDFFGTPYGDGDFYKLMEAMIYAWAASKDAELDRAIDDYIALIGRAQQPDGYISTKQIIGELLGSEGVSRHGDINDFEVYNFGHMFTCACAHKRITGKDNFLSIALKAADYLKEMYEESHKAGEVKTAVCPSHYMGLVELYRLTGSKKYLDLAQMAIDLRDEVKNGTDDNQDRIPLREHRKIVGHGVRSTYLYGGVADLYMETGESALKTMLDSVWHDLVEKKIYITGGCGALYSGVSPYGMIMGDQRVHQAFGYEYQLPNITAYNETCATLGDVFWTYRMFAIDPQAKYFDLIERSMLNLALAAISIHGDKYFYENMLRRTKELGFEVQWPLTRAHQLICFCCPTNLSRCLMQAKEYAYMQGDDCVYTGMYMPGSANFHLKNGAAFTLTQNTCYPWDGAIRFEAEGLAPDAAFTLKVRIPGWVRSGSLSFAGKTVPLTKAMAGSYYDIPVSAQHNLVDVTFDMPARFTVSHPKVEENTNQIAVERGPLVYCMESPDTTAGTLDDIMLPSDIRLTPQSYTIEGLDVVALCGEAALLEREDYDPELLYQDLPTTHIKSTSIRMIPYFAWDNRGFGEMRIWMPLLLK